MKLVAGASKDAWVIEFMDLQKEPQTVEAKSRAEIYAFVRAHRALGGDDDALLIRRLYEAAYTPEGD